MNICNSKQVHHLGPRYFSLHLKLLGVLHAVKNAGDLPKHWTTASCEQESFLCHPLSTWVAAFLGRLSSKVSSGAAMGFEELGRGWAGDHSQKLQRKQPGAKDGIVVQGWRFPVQGLDTSNVVLAGRAAANKSPADGWWMSWIGNQRLIGTPWNSVAHHNLHHVFLLLQWFHQMLW